jgi:hypothetical protein
LGNVAHSSKIIKSHNLTGKGNVKDDEEREFKNACMKVWNYWRKVSIKESLTSGILERHCIKMNL